MTNETFYQFTAKTENIKTGAMPVTVSSSKTCPDACPFKGKDINGKGNGCYAGQAPMVWNWNKVTSGELGGNINQLANNVASLPENQIARYGVAGDFPGINNKINGRDLRRIVSASKGKRLFGYSHKPVLGSKQYVKQNRKHIKHANKNGFTINLSGNSMSHADKLKKLKIAPVVAIVPFGTPNTFFTPAGNKGVICPAQREGGKATCLTCQLCQKTERSVIVGFIPHSSSKNKVNQISLAS